MKIILPLFLIALFQQSYSQNLSDSILLSSFYQGSANNCASVALIKAAMLKYGYKNIYKLNIQNNGYQIKFRDSTLLTVTEAERAMAANYSDFDTSGRTSTLGTERDSVLFYLYMSYACIAKYIQNYGYYLCEEQGNYHEPPVGTFLGALQFITDQSFCTDNCFRYLGLKIKDNEVKDFTSQSDISAPGIILYSHAHAVVCFDNQIDCHGEWIPASTYKICYNRFKWYIEIN
jgi:hypothetical protein